MPDEIYFLCFLHNIGATSLDRALAFEEIVKWTAMEPEKVRSNMHKLVEDNYVQLVSIEGAERYLVTAEGIRRVLSIHS